MAGARLAGLTPETVAKAEASIDVNGVNKIASLSFVRLESDLCNKRAPKPALKAYRTRKVATGVGLQAELHGFGVLPITLLASLSSCDHRGRPWHVARVQY